jgi:hypothetical protein
LKKPKDFKSLRQIGIERGWISSDPQIQRKTDSRHGLIRRYVLHLAKSIQFMTVDDLMPLMTRPQAYSALQQAVKYGQMKIYQKGKSGPTPRRTLFISVDNQAVYGRLSLSQMAKSLKRTKGKII